MKHYVTAILGSLVAALVISSARPALADSLRWLDLGGTWKVAQAGSGDEIAAQVPGCIHTDLQAAGKIPDPFYGDNEHSVQWVSDVAWVYHRSFSVDASLLQREHVLLHCEGLDTLATIKVNGREIARTDNMFRPYEFDVKGALQPGDNAIEVRFDPVVPFVRAKEAQRKLPTWAYPGAGYVRKEPCNFGWDWGPTLITCGIWKKISLVAFDTARLDDVAIAQDHSQKGQVTLSVDVAAGPATTAALQAEVGVSFGSEQIGRQVINLDKGRGRAEIAVASPKLWWPAGMGSQPLYVVKVELRQGGQVLDSASKRIGLRTMQAVQQTKTSPLHFVVNGVPFFAKGANWIPADCFANRVTRPILERYVDDAVAANMNTLRLWGGGYYEDDDLFDLCDQRGLCLWVDLKFGCTTYPAFDEAFLANVRAEARDNLRRLRHHPSIAVWCGNNEIMFFRGGDRWTKDKMSAPDYYRLFRDVLGGEVAALAPGSDYVTGSPDCGDVHFWEVWHGGKPFEVYRNIHGFVSEFGFQSFAEPKTVRSFTAAADRSSVYSPVMKYHERSNRMYMDVKEDGRIGTDKIMILVRKYFREPKDFETTLWLSQITQGYGIKYGAEGWRREMPKSMGCVYWQYNDCWPCTSWASVDYFGRWKALQYMAQRFYAPVLVSGAEDAQAGTVDLYITSDQLQGDRGRLSWTVTTVAGEVINAGALDVDIPAQSSRKAKSLALAGELKKYGKNNVLVWMSLEVAGRKVSDNMTALAYPKEMNLVDPHLTTEVTQQEGRFSVKLKAAHPALWTWLELDGLDARCSQNFVHVTDRQPVEITVQPAQPLTLPQFEKALRVRSLFDTYVK